MMITKHTVARKLEDYLHHRLALVDLVDWAEDAMMEGEFDPVDFETLREVIARTGLAEVRAFGLTWDNCEELLGELGYSTRVEVLPSQSALA